VSELSYRTMMSNGGQSSSILVGEREAGIAAQVAQDILCRGFTLL
jgi:hypothetical protein